MFSAPSPSTSDVGSLGETAKVTLGRAADSSLHGDFPPSLALPPPGGTEFWILARKKPLPDISGKGFSDPTLSHLLVLTGMLRAGLVQGPLLPYRAAPTMGPAGAGPDGSSETPVSTPRSLRSCGSTRSRTLSPHGAPRGRISSWRECSSSGSGSRCTGRSAASSPRTRGSSG